jgi:hypothetical protein
MKLKLSVFVHTLEDCRAFVSMLRLSDQRRHDALKREVIGNLVGVRLRLTNLSVFLKKG